MPGIGIGIRIGGNGGGESWDPLKELGGESVNFWTKSRSGLSLVDSVSANNSTLLPPVAQCNGTNFIYINTTNVTSGEVIVHCLQPVKINEDKGIVYGTSSRIQLRTTTAIGIQMGGVWKIFNCANISTTAIQVIRLVIRIDTNTKARVYVDGVESSSGEQDYGGLKTFNIDRIGFHGQTSYISYLKAIEAGVTVLEMYPNGLGLYEYDIAAGSTKIGSWTGTHTTAYRADGKTYMLDNGFTTYEKPALVKEYVPFGGYVTGLIGGNLEYQLDEVFTGSLTKYNLVPSLIQMVGAVWDRSDTNIWNNLARAGYYDATNATTKKRWHSSELNQATFKLWLNVDYQDIVFTKFEYNSEEKGRMLEEIFSFATVKTGSDLSKALQYTGYKTYVQGLTSQFVIDTILGQLDWTDSLPGATYEIWSSINGRARTLITTTASSVITYNDTGCKQGAWMKYWIRSKKSGVYGAFSSATIFQTPLCWKTDQSTLTNVVINILTINTGGTVNVDWGNGTNNNYTVGINNNITKGYGVGNEGQYNISLSGDIRRIITFEHRSQVLSYGNIANWIVPYDCITFHPYGNSFTGDISDHINYFSSALRIYDIQSLPVTGDISNWRFGTTGIYDIHFENTGVTGDITNWTFPATISSPSSKLILQNTVLTGNITNWRLPDGMCWLNIIGSNITCDWTDFYFPASLLLINANSEASHTNTFSGNCSGWTLPSTESIYVTFNFEFAYSNLTGDMSGVLIPVFTKATVLSFSYNDITKLPRGDFKWISVFNFNYNNCNTAEIDAFLAYVDAYFAGGVVPLTNAVYILGGTGMGIPSASGLASKASIEGKYAAAGKTITITVNS